MRGLWSLWRGSFSLLLTLATHFIYPCSHLSNAGTEQLMIFGETGLTASVSPSICIEWAARLFWSTSAANWCRSDWCFRISGIATLFGCERPACIEILNTGSSLPQLGDSPVELKEPHPVPPRVPTRMCSEPLTRRVTVSPLLTYYTASESAI